MSWPRVLTLMGLVALVLLAATSSAFGATSTDMHACASACTGGAKSSVTQPGAKQSTPCVRDAGCGGGGALGQMGTPLIVALAAGTITLVAVLVRRRFRTSRMPSLFGTLLANRLFHPPQFVLGS